MSRLGGGKKMVVIELERRELEKLNQLGIKYEDNPCKECEVINLLEEWVTL